MNSKTIQKLKDELALKQLMIKHYQRTLDDNIATYEEFEALENNLTNYYNTMGVFEKLNLTKNSDSLSFTSFLRKNSENDEDTSIF